MLHKVIGIKLVTNLSCIFLVMFILEGVSNNFVLLGMRHDDFCFMLASHSIVSDIKNSVLLNMHHDDVTLPM